MGDRLPRPPRQAPSRVGLAGGAQQRTRTTQWCFGLVGTGVGVAVGVAVVLVVVGTGVAELDSEVDGSEVDGSEVDGSEVDGISVGVAHGVDPGTEVEGSTGMPVGDGLAGVCGAWPDGAWLDGACPDCAWLDGAWLDGA
jgi:hypothetical protein